MKKILTALLFLTLATVQAQTSKTFSRKEVTFGASYVPTQFGTGTFNIELSPTWGGTDLQIGLLIKTNSDFDNIKIGAIGKTRLFDIGSDTKIGGSVEVDGDIVTTPKTKVIPISLGFGINYAYYFKGTWVTGAYGKVFVFGQAGTLPKECGGFVAKTF